MKKKIRDWVVVAVIIVIGALAIYGAMVWFFPSTLFASMLVLPVVAPTLYLTIRLFRFAPYRQRQSKLVRLWLYLGSIVMLQLMAWCVVAFGIPALIMTAFGPNERMVASVLSKDDGPRSCPNQVVLAELSAPLRRELCVSVSLYNNISPGQRVQVHVRRNVFGTRVFRIEPS